MGRKACCSRDGLKKGAWSAEEDRILKAFIETNGEGRWRSLPRKAGLKRCGRSCRLRWLNYLRPDIKRGNISAEEEDLIIRLHKLLGNRWSLIAGRIPGRTDNEIKNYWNTTLKKRFQGEHYSPPPLPPNRKKLHHPAEKEEELVMETGAVTPQCTTTDQVLDTGGDSAFEGLSSTALEQETWDFLLGLDMSKGSFSDSLDFNFFPEFLTSDMGLEFESLPSFLDHQEGF